jgi:hypothetical protein
MTKRLLCCAVATLMAVATVPAYAAKAAQPVAWGRLSSVVQQKTVELVLPDGVELGGRITDVQSDKLVLDVTKTSDRKAFPKGSTTLPRSSVRALAIRQHGNKATIIGAAAGLAAGIVLGNFANTYAHNEGDGAPGLVALTVALPTALGFLIGYGIDSGKKTRIILTD